MADESTFGGQLDPGSQFGASFAGNDAPDTPPAPTQAPAAAPPGAPMNISAPAGMPAAASPAQPAQGGGFGAGFLSKMFDAPNYRPPDPTASPLDQSADLLAQRVQRANKIATDPNLQFFDPEGVANARNLATQGAEKLQQIRTQQAAIKAGRTQAETLGLQPGDVPDEATEADRVQVAVNKSLKGDLRAAQGLAAVKPDVFASIEDRVHEVTKGHIDKAQTAFEALSAVGGQSEYNAKLAQLRKDGTLTELEALGLKVPPTLAAFEAGKADEGRALREARIGSQNLDARIAERTNGTPMAKPEAETYKGRLTTAYGDSLDNGNWQRINGKRVFVVNGMGTVDEVGKKAVLASPEQRTALHADTKAAVEDKEMEKFRNFNRTRDLATKDPKGNFIPPEGVVDPKNPGRRIYMNDNPNVQQGVAEGLASMLRGGTGGATSGLLNIETSKRGYVQAAIDKILTNYAGGLDTLTGAQVRPYLSQLTEEQQRSVLDGLASYSGKSIADRMRPIAERAGALGLDSSALGLAKGEIAGVDEALERGRQSTINRFGPRQRATGAGDGGIYLDEPPTRVASLPDAVQPQDHGPVPPAVQRQQPAPPVAAPAPAPTSGPTAPGGGTPPAPSGLQGSQAPVTPGPAGGVPPAPGSGPSGGPNAPAPVTIAGQQVTVPTPPGASPNFTPSLQRIESGNSKDPWTAEAGRGPDGKPMSTASGAFQMIDGTWNENKPAGATAMRAKDATPAQQSQAFANLTAKNGAALAKAGVPVNDTSLYVAHNLGATGAQKLLTADPNADARTVVGDVAARNNPTFFKGKPTVAKALERYRTEMNQEPPKLPPTNVPDTGTQYSMPPTGIEGMSREDIQKANDNTVEHAPAIGSTIGALVGTAGGPVGSVAGGAAGGGAGQSFKDWMQGRDQDPKAIAKEAALGGVLGIASEARPFVSLAARVGGAGAVEAGDAAAKGGDTADIVDAGLKGAGWGLTGEALSRFVSSGGAAAFKALSRYTEPAQKELSAAAGKLADARATLEKEPPKLGVGDGATVNPKYEAAEKAEEEATAVINDHGQKPDDMVHAYEQAKAGVSSGEAATMRGAAAEKSATSEGYNQLREDVQNAKPNEKNIKPNQPVADGPQSMLRTADNPTGKVEAKFAADAEHAEMLIKAPAKDWGEKWSQLQNAGSELVKKRLDFLRAGDKTSAKAMDDLFDGVRNQQRAAAEYVFGPQRGAEVIKNLETLDTRYAKVMNATAGMDYQKMRGILAQGNTPEARELEKNFREFNKGDPSAMRAFNAMKAGAKGRLGEEAKLMAPIIAGEFATHMAGIPTMGAISAAIGGHRLYKLAQQYMDAKLLGKVVTFKDFLKTELPKIATGPVADVTRRAVVQQ